MLKDQELAYKAKVLAEEAAVKKAADEAAAEIKRAEQLRLREEKAAAKAAAEAEEARLAKQMENIDNLSEEK
jgi:hypothetical protein